jgi:hypothetical protein
MQLRYAAQYMMLPLCARLETEYVLAPVGLSARRLSAMSKRYDVAPRIRLTTQMALTRFLMRQPHFAHEAADGLAERMTWVVHMRSPLRLWREGGIAGFAILNLLVGGNVLTALAYPVLLGAVGLEVVATLDAGHALSPFNGTFAGLHLATVAIGCVSSVAVNVIGLARRRLLHEAWVLLLTPLYWSYLSIAAWRALFQLFYDPYRWEKTEHGLARHSRLASRRSK